MQDTTSQLTATPHNGGPAGGSNSHGGAIGTVFSRGFSSPHGPGDNLVPAPISTQQSGGGIPAPLLNFGPQPHGGTIGTVLSRASGSFNLKPGDNFAPVFTSQQSSGGIPVPPRHVSHPRGSAIGAVLSLSPLSHETQENSSSARRVQVSPHPLNTLDDPFLNACPIPHQINVRPFASRQINGVSPVLAWALTAGAQSALELLDSIYPSPGSPTVSISFSNRGALAKKIEFWDAAAQSICDELHLKDVSSDAEAFDMTTVDQSTAAMQRVGLQQLISDRISLKKFRGLKQPDLENLTAALPNGAAVMDLMADGQRAFMRPDFRPNGCLHFRQSKSYSIGRAACHRTLQKMMTAGEILAVRLDLVPAQDLATLHASRLLRAPKPGEPDGRICLHASSTEGAGSWSLNGGYDLDSSDRTYPQPYLPDVQAVCELICRRQELFPGQQLHGATADVKSAYCQIPLSAAAAKLRATIITVGPENTRVLILYLVSIFGDTRAGHTYCVAGQAISDLHNLKLPTPRSLTYIDDGILVDPQPQLDSSLGEYVNLIRQFFGPDGVSMKKIATFDSSLTAIGWSFDLRQDIWRVRPKDRGLAKLHLALFYTFPPACTSSNDHRLFPRRTVLQLAGLLSWYSVVIPTGPAFVLSIYHTAGFGPLDGKVCLSEPAKHDIEWWRALLFFGLIDDSHLCLSTPIYLMRCLPEIAWMLTTDASTSVGGGAWLSRFADPTFTPHGQGCIRWRPEELAVIESNAGIINVLEYITVIYYVLCWGHLLRDSVVAVRCDNTAAVSWLSKNRSGGQLKAAYDLIQIASVFMAAQNIKLSCTHLAGILNELADHLSRDISLQEFIELRGTTQPSTAPEKAALWRALFLSALTSQSTLHLHSALKQALGQL